VLNDHFKDKQLVRENEWIRIYNIGPGQQYYESKFVHDNVQVLAKSIESRWHTLSAEEQADFVMAFQSKYPLTSEDEEILEFLMNTGDENVWSTLALPLTRMSSSKHEKALAFLIERIQRRDTHRANYYQALGELKDTKAIPALKVAYEEERRTISLDKPLTDFQDIFPYIDYLACCAALYILEGSKEFKQAIEALKSHPNENVRSQANLALRSS